MVVELDIPQWMGVVIVFFSIVGIIFSLLIPLFLYLAFRYSKHNNYGKTIFLVETIKQ